MRRSQDLESSLFAEVGRLKCELDWLKKVWSFGVHQRRALVERLGAQFDLTRQCELLGVRRSSLYYTPVGVGAEDLIVMRHLDDSYTR